MRLGLVMTLEQTNRLNSMCEEAKEHVDELLVLLSKSKMLNILYVIIPPFDFLN
jgi:hypothetical protein